MADKTWKKAERVIAEYFTIKLGIEVRRNDARVNANDPSRNSDVDIVHKALEHKGSHGLTVESKYRSNEFKTIYCGYKSIDGKNKCLIVNGKYYVVELDNFLPMWNKIIANDLKSCTMKEINIKRGLKTIENAFNKSRIYGQTKNLTPTVCIRRKNQRALVVVSIQDI